VTAANDALIERFYAAFAALGLPGLLLGWTPLVQSAVRRRARASLDDFLARDG
jgi:hypothetical protein